MTIDKDIALSLLRLTQNGSVHKEAIGRHARVAARLADQHLTELSQSNFFYESEGVIEASPTQRVKLALHVLKSGADLQRVCNLLSWKEFENIAAEAFEANGYFVLRNFRFKHAQRRWEIDLIGHKKPLIACVDCKHWKRGWEKSATANAVQLQIERTKAFSKELGNYHQEIRVEGWESVTLIPMVVSLTLGPYRVYSNVPIVPVLQLQDFINEFPAHAHLLRNFHQKNLRLDADLSTILSKQTKDRKMK